MRFDEALAATIPPKRRSKFAIMLDAVPDAERTRIVAALEDRAISAERIRLALAAIGMTVGRSSIERWRNDESVR